MTIKKSRWTLVSELSFGSALLILGFSFYSWGMDKLTNPPAREHRRLAVEALTAKDYDGAITEYQMASALEPTNAVIPYELGLVYQVMGKTDDAIAAWSKSLRLDAGMTQASRALRDIGTQNLMPNDVDHISNLLTPSESTAVRTLSMDALGSWAH